VNILNSVELNSTNVITEDERSGTARSLFWPWAAANVSLLALGYGGLFLDLFNISFWQAVIAAFVGTVSSFGLVAVSSIAGKRSSAPTMTLSRAAFGVKGNLLPGLLSYLTFVGWETVLVALATLASRTVLVRVGHINHNLALIIGFILAAGLVIFGGVLGFQTIMKIQRWLTLTTVVLTLGYVALTWHKINWHTIHLMHSGTTAGVIGATIFAITGIGLGWVNSAADYSRYLPRSVTNRAVVGWTILGASVVPIVLVIFGTLLSASSPTLKGAIEGDPVGALTSILPTWFLIPFALVAILGLIGGAILDLYSSGIALVSIGFPYRRHFAAGIDALIMLVGTIYIAWHSPSFVKPFQVFLITLGVPIASWSAIFVADVVLRRAPYVSEDLFNPRGRYGSWNLRSILLLIGGTIVGWGFVTNSDPSAHWLNWQGYFMSAIGGKSGQWAPANVGVIFALVVGFAGHILLSRRVIAKQEAHNG
jgi:purine-cytosine permease-like protein